MCLLYWPVKQSLVEPKAFLNLQGKIGLCMRCRVSLVPLFSLIVLAVMVSALYYFCSIPHCTYILVDNRCWSDTIWPLTLEFGVKATLYNLVCLLDAKITFSGLFLQHEFSLMVSKESFIEKPVSTNVTESISDISGFPAQARLGEESPIGVTCSMTWSYSVYSVLPQVLA